MITGTFSVDFADWRKESITYYAIDPSTPYDAHGKPNYQGGVSTACYIMMQPKLIRDQTGAQVVSSAQIYLVGSSSYSTRDKYQLPDGKTPPVMRIDDYYNDKGVLELTVVYI
jgi:hypothetical protein